MRPEVMRLVALGPLPLEDDERPLEQSLALLEEYARNLSGLEPPATDAEALALLAVFNPDEDDSCFGLAWSLLHFIETAPSWPGPPATSAIGQAIKLRLQGAEEPWLHRLWQRILNWRLGGV